MVAAIVAILKFFKRHLPNHRSDWVKTWWEASERHRDSELLKLVHSDIPEGRHGGRLEIFKWHFLPNQKLDWAKIWWEALERHRDSELFKSFRLAIQDGRLEDLELLKSFRSDIQDRRRVSHLGNLQTTSPPAILKVFNCYLVPNNKSFGAETWWKASGQHGHLEFLKWFCSDIQDSHHGSHFENLQITSATD